MHYSKRNLLLPLQRSCYRSGQRQRRRKIMERETPAPAAPEFSPEALELIEAHRTLMARYRIALANESDDYSLAQPSPYPFVPSVASDGTYTLPEGE
jgi:hypothetical protein